MKPVFIVDSSRSGPIHAASRKRDAKAGRLAVSRGGFLVSFADVWVSGEVEQHSQYSKAGHDGRSARTSSTSKRAVYTCIRRDDREPERTPPSLTPQPGRMRILR